MAKTQYEVTCKRHDQVQGILSWGVFAGGLLYGTKYLPNRLQEKPKRFFSIIWLFGITMKFSCYQGFKWSLGKTFNFGDNVTRFGSHFLDAVIWHPQTSKGEDDVIRSRKHFMTAVILHQLITTISNHKTNQENFYLKIQWLQRLINDQLTSFHGELKSYKPVTGEDFPSLSEPMTIPRSQWFGYANKLIAFIKERNSTTESTKKEQQKFINDLVAKSNETPEATKQFFGNMQTQIETYLNDIEKPGNVTLVKWLQNLADSYWVLYLAMGSFLLFDPYISDCFRKECKPVPPEKYNI